MLPRENSEETESNHEEEPEENFEKHSYTESSKRETEGDKKLPEKLNPSITVSDQ